MITLSAVESMLRATTVPRVVLHPLRFLCVPIVRRPAYGVCAHVWNDGMRASETIHAHSWDLHSHVVAGALTNETFDVTEHGRGLYRVVHVHSRGMDDYVAPTNKIVDPGEPTGTFHREGESYEMAAGTFHRSIPVQGRETMTIVVARTVPGGHDKVLMSLAVQASTTHRELASRSRSVATVRAVRDALRSRA